MPRQALALSIISGFIHDIEKHNIEKNLREAVLSALAISLAKETDLTNSLCGWKPDAECPVHMYARQAIPMLWDFAEAVTISESSGSWYSMVERTAYAIEVAALPAQVVGQAVQSSATSHSLPTDSVNVYFTDPPYYDSVPYAHLSDFFYVWLRRLLAGAFPDLFSMVGVPKENEIVVDRPHELSNSTHDVTYYEVELTKAFGEGRRVLAPDGIGAIVFASKTTSGWEAILKAVIEAGWIITASWPIDTEMDTRVAAQGQARLASSIHLVCRPRESADGMVPETVGDWRNVLSELPGRIHSWLPRLAQEGVVGADAIFACLGPALEIYSRYSRVETASGDEIPLGDVVQNGKVIQRGYLSFVWEAVAREALGMIFQGADASGFEADARLTAMWLWTLSTKENGGKPVEAAAEEELDADDEEKLAQSLSAYTLEYDAARKIGQGLGAHLEKLEDLVAFKGDQARLKTVRERSAWLFGNAGSNPLVEKRRPAAEQLNLFSLLPESPDGIGQPFDAGEAFPTGETTLARLHQAMLLFGGGRGEALKRFLVDQGVGKDNRFWHLAQALSALYPSGSDEKRWVDGVLARKKGLGF